MKSQKAAVEKFPEAFYLPVGLGPSFVSAFFLAGGSTSDDAMNRPKKAENAPNSTRKLNLGLQFQQAYFGGNDEAAFFGFNFVDGHVVYSPCA